MKKKDRSFLVEVHIPKSEGEDTVFLVTLEQLYNAIKTHPSGDIVFRIGDELVPIQRNKVIEIYKCAKQQLISKNIQVPLQLKDYLVDLSTADKVNTQTKKFLQEMRKLKNCGHVCY